MDLDRRLPGGLRQLLEQALERVAELRHPLQADEEVLLQGLDELRAHVADALSVVRGTDLPGRAELLRALKVADGILLHLADPTQRDARGRLRDVEARLREALGRPPGASRGSL